MGDWDEDDGEGYILHTYDLLSNPNPNPNPNPTSVGIAPAARMRDTTPDKP